MVWAGASFMGIDAEVMVVLSPLSLVVGGGCRWHGLGRCHQDHPKPPRTSIPIVRKAAEAS